VTAVLAAIGRAVACVVFGAALVLFAVVAVLWPGSGSQGPWLLAWLGVAAVVAAGFGVALEWLGNRRRGGAR
jgi:drug/metabolite transporter (DMT)-like permease